MFYYKLITVYFTCVFCRNEWCHLSKMSGRNRCSISNNNINNISGNQKRKIFLWNLDLCEFVVHSRNTATACSRLTNYYAAVGGAVGLEGLGSAHWLLFPSHVTVQLVEILTLPHTPCFLTRARHCWVFILRSQSTDLLQPTWSWSWRVWLRVQTEEG